MPTEKQPADPARRQLVGWLARYGVAGLLAVAAAIVLRIGVGEALMVCVTTAIVFGLTQVVVGWLGRQSKS